MDPAQLHLETSEQSGRPVVTVRGEIDLATAPALERHLDAQDSPPVVDLTEVTFIDSTGLRVIIAAHESGGGLPLVVVEGPVTRLLEITGLADRLLTFDSVAAALSDG